MGLNTKCLWVPNSHNGGYKCPHKESVHIAMSYALTLILEMLAAHGSVLQLNPYAAGFLTCPCLITGIGAVVKIVSLHLCSASESRGSVDISLLIA